jgi:hypothetical protein
LAINASSSYKPSLNSRIIIAVHSAEKSCLSIENFDEDGEPTYDISEDQEEEDREQAAPECMTLEEGYEA